MLHNFYLFRSAPRIMLVSSVVFVFLNFIENIIHYSIGVHSDKQSVRIIAPTRKDIIRIIATMLVFAILQGLFTYAFMKYHVL